MAYLEQKGIVHRDLAARNILGKSGWMDNSDLINCRYDEVIIECDLHL